MMLLKNSFRRIVKDFRHKELLPLKLIFFVQASTLYVLYPYLTIHMRELGINVEETAIMSAVTPFVAIIMPPLAGLIADRIGNFKILLSLFSSLGGGAALLLLLVPIGRVTVQFPDRVVMNIGCPGSNGEMVYGMDQSHPCVPNLQPEIHTRLESCGFVCRADIRNETDLQKLLSSRMYTVDYYDFETGTNSSFKYTLSNSDLPRTTDKPDVMENRKLTNNEFFKTSIRRISKHTYFFPTNQLYEFSCRAANETSANDNAVQGNGTFCNFGPLSKENSGRSMNNQSYKSKLKSLEQTESDLAEERRNFAVEKTAWSAPQDFHDVFCENPSTRQERVALRVPRPDNSDNDFDVRECSKSCVITAPRKHVCSNTQMEIEYNIRLTFWLYLVIRVFIGMIGGTAFAMFEGAVIAILREQKADYGLQRIYGSIGGMISSPLSGLLIDYASAGKGYTDFRPAFYLYAALKIASGILMLTINLEFKSPANNVVSDVVSVLKKVEVIALFIACFILGTAWGYIESFLFWLIQDLGGSRSLMGITITVGGIAGIPLLVLSGPIIAKIGHANVLFIGCVFYAVRLLGYSLIYNPWFTLIFEALESVTSSLSFTAAVTYAAKLSTTTTDSSIQGLLGGLYYGVGKGSGSLIGGYLMKAFGTRPTYQIFAVLTLVTGLIYFFFNLLYLRKRPQEEGNDIVKKPPKTAKNQNGLENGVVEIPLDEKKPPKSERIIEDGIENEGFAENCTSKDIEAVNNAKNELKCLPKDEKPQDNTRSEQESPSKDLEGGVHFQNEVNRPSKDTRTSVREDKCPSENSEETNNTRIVSDPSKEEETVNANNMEKKSNRTKPGNDRRISKSSMKQDEPTAKENPAFSHEDETDRQQNAPEVGK